MLTHENVLPMIAEQINQLYKINITMNISTGTGLSLQFISTDDFDKITKLLTLEKQFVIKGHARAEGGYIYILHSDTQRFLHDVAQFSYEEEALVHDNVDRITHVLYEKIKVSQRSLVEAEISERISKQFQESKRENEQFYVEQIAAGIRSGSLISTLFSSFKLNPFEMNLNCEILAGYFKQIFPDSNIGVSLTEHGLKIHFIPQTTDTDTHISNQALTRSQNDCLQLQAYLEAIVPIAPTTLSYEGRHLTIRHQATPFLLECFNYQSQQALQACNHLYLNETGLTYSEYIIRNNKKLTSAAASKMPEKSTSLNRSASMPSLMFPRGNVYVDTLAFTKEKSQRLAAPPFSSTRKVSPSSSPTTPRR